MDIKELKPFEFDKQLEKKRDELARPIERRTDEDEGARGSLLVAVFSAGVAALFILGVVFRFCSDRDFGIAMGAVTSVISIVAFMVLAFNVSEGGQDHHAGSGRSQGPSGRRPGFPQV